MAQSRFKSEQYTSEEFVESAGAVLFRLSSREICVLRLLDREEYILAKGRRNCGEACQAAALREVTEETGFACRLLPLNMYTRAPPAVETEQAADQARFYTGVYEPFTLQVRHLGEGHVKLIWWFVAAVDEETPPKDRDAQDKNIYAVEFYSYTDVLDKLTFQTDRDMVKKAIELVENTYNTQ
jgi:8-oxo-dGTP pyrophosphatase MutT (NUDIX family)